jgi:hypothetical protein
MTDKLGLVSLALTVIFVVSLPTIGDVIALGEGYLIQPSLAMNFDT